MASERYLVKEESGFCKNQIVLNNPVEKRGYVPEGGHEIFISQIPENGDVWDLADFLSQAGKIYQLRLMMGGNSTRNLGFGYVIFMNVNAADIAMNDLVKRDFMGNKLRMVISSNNHRLIITGIPNFKTRDEIWNELRFNGVEYFIDVIPLKSSYYTELEPNGSVFVYFMTYDHAVYVMSRFANNLRLWNRDVVIDWLIPVPETDDEVLRKSKVIYLRNLKVTQTEEELANLMYELLGRGFVQKVQKIRDYAFVHLESRDLAEAMMSKLTDQYHSSIVEMEWAKPSKRLNPPIYRTSGMLPWNTALLRGITTSFFSAPATARTNSMSSDKENTSPEHVKDVISIAPSRNKQNSIPLRPQPEKVLGNQNNSYRPPPLSSRLRDLTISYASASCPKVTPQPIKPPSSRTPSELPPLAEMKDRNNSAYHAPSELHYIRLYQQNRLNELMEKKGKNIKIDYSDVAFAYEDGDRIILDENRFWE